MEISLSIIPHKLTWLTAKYVPPGRVLNSDQVTNKQEFPYIPLHSENGPIDLPTTIEFCKKLESLLKEGPVIHYCSVKPIEKSNGAYLMGAFLVLALKQTAQQAWENFQNLPLLFLHYRDAAPGFSSYKCSILHCLQVLYKAVQFRWINYEDFNVEKHRSLYSLENGDITWIVPNKVAVFSCPSSEPRDVEGQRNYTPESYSALFQQIGIKTVVRVDGYPYETDRFIRNGIKFIDLSFKGPLPPMNIISRFFDVMDMSDYSVAVHCKAGLGKSPTLVGMYVMKKFDVSAEEYIAWARICRPASIIGQQQDFIKQLEGKCKMIKKKEYVNSLTFSKESSFFRSSRRSSFKNTSSNLEIRNSMKTFGKGSKLGSHSSLGRLLTSQKSHQSYSLSGGSKTHRVL